MRQIRPLVSTRALGCKPDARDELASTDGVRANPQPGMENEGHTLV